jgi:hypothetical protein
MVETKSLWVEVESMFFWFVGFVIGLWNRDPPERYWSFPFIASRKGQSCTREDGEREKRKTKREGKVSRSCTVPLPLSVAL